MSSDDDGLIEMLTTFKGKPVDLPKVTISLDEDYHPDYLTKKLEQVYLDIMTKIQFEHSHKPSKQKKLEKGISGFIPVKARWVVERSNAWVERCKALVKNFEKNLNNATAKLNLCFVRLLAKRIANATT